MLSGSVYSLIKLAFQIVHDTLAPCESMSACIWYCSLSHKYTYAQLRIFVYGSISVLETFNLMFVPCRHSITTSQELKPHVIKTCRRKRTVLLRIVN